MIRFQRVVKPERCSTPRRLCQDNCGRHGYARIGHSGLVLQHLRPLFCPEHEGNPVARSCRARVQALNPDRGSRDHRIEPGGVKEVRTLGLDAQARGVPKSVFLRQIHSLKHCGVAARERGNRAASRRRSIGAAQRVGGLDLHDLDMKG